MCAVAVMAQTPRIITNIQNDAVSKYLSEVMYTSQEDTSCVSDYCISTDIRLDVPKPAVIEIPERYQKFISNGSISIRYCFDGTFDGEVTDTIVVQPGELSAAIYDIQPGITCYYKMYLMNILIAWGQIMTEGPVRMLNTPSIPNVRDLGGWATADGRTIKYGKLIRGGELNGLYIADDSDIQHLLKLGVSAEIDLRANYEEVHGISAFNFKDATEVESDEVPSYLYTDDSGQILNHMNQHKFLQRWFKEFKFIVDNLSEGRTIYFHCRYGADRTGYLSLLLEGLLGVPYDGLMKDYELTSFANMSRNKETIDPVITFIEKLDGETLQEKFNTFWTKRVGVRQEDVDYFIDEMLDGEKPGSDVVTSIATIQQSVSSTNYDLTGRRVSARHQGLIISRQDDGSVRKILKIN